MLLTSGTIVGKVRKINLNEHTDNGRYWIPGYMYVLDTYFCFAKGGMYGVVVHTCKYCISRVDIVVGSGGVGRAGCASAMSIWSTTYIYVCGRMLLRIYMYGTPRTGYWKMVSSKYRLRPVSVWSGHVGDYTEYSTE